MKRLVTTTLCLMVMITLSAQTTFETKAKEIAEQIEQITVSEKLLLKEKIAEINDKLDQGTITKAEAEKLSMEAAQMTSDSITAKVGLLQDEFSSLIQQKVNEEIDETTVEKVDMDPSPWDDSEEWGYGDDEDHDHDWDFDFNFKNRNESRLTSQFVFAFGVNSLIENSDLGTISDSPLRTFDSRFYEYGLTGKYRLSPTSNFFHLKYGLSLLYSRLSPKNNNYYVVDGIETRLQNFDGSLNKNELRNVFFTAPIHLELDFTKATKDSEGKQRFRTQKAVRLGMGGFFGIKTGSRQTLEYNQNGNKFEVIEKGNFNVNQFIYGLSAYFGYRSWTVYANYQINPVFENNDVDQRLVSLGLRLDWN